MNDLVDPWRAILLPATRFVPSLYAYIPGRPRKYTHTQIYKNSSTPLAQ